MMMWRPFEEDESEIARLTKERDALRVALHREIDARIAAESRTLCADGLTVALADAEDRLRLCADEVRRLRKDREDALSDLKTARDERDVAQGLLSREEKWGEVYRGQRDTLDAEVQGMSARLAALESLRADLAGLPLRGSDAPFPYETLAKIAERARALASEAPPPITTAPTGETPQKAAAPITTQGPGLDADGLRLKIQEAIGSCGADDCAGGEGFPCDACEERADRLVAVAEAARAPLLVRLAEVEAERDRISDDLGQRIDDTALEYAATLGKAHEISEQWKARATAAEAALAKVGPGVDAEALRALLARVTNYLETATDLIVENDVCVDDDEEEDGDIADARALIADVRAILVGAAPAPPAKSEASPPGMRKCRGCVECADTCGHDFDCQCDLNEPAGTRCKAGWLPEIAPLGTAPARDRGNWAAGALYRELDEQADKGGLFDRGVLTIAQDVHMTTTGAYDRAEENQTQDVDFLARLDAMWLPSPQRSRRWDDAVRGVVRAALADARGEGTVPGGYEVERTVTWEPQGLRAHVMTPDGTRCSVCGLEERYITAPISCAAVHIVKPEEAGVPAPALAHTRSWAAAREAWDALAEIAEFDPQIKSTDPLWRAIMSLQSPDDLEREAKAAGQWYACGGLEESGHHAGCALTPLAKAIERLRAVTPIADPADPIPQGQEDDHDVTQRDPWITIRERAKEALALAQGHDAVRRSTQAIVDEIDDEAHRTPASITAWCVEAQIAAKEARIWTLADGRESLYARAISDVAKMVRGLA